MHAGLQSWDSCIQTTNDSNYLLTVLFAAATLLLAAVSSAGSAACGPVQEGVCTRGM